MRYVGCKVKDWKLSVAIAAMYGVLGGSLLAWGTKGVRNRFLSREVRSRNLGAWVDRIEPLRVGISTMC